MNVPLQSPMAQLPYDVEQIRADFPILSRQVNDKQLVYLDNGASAQKPRAVIDRLAEFYAHEYSNVHRGLHYLSNRATECFEEARQKLRAFIGAPESEEIIFTRSSTEAINLVAQAQPEGTFSPGDEIVLTIAEHHSNIVPWHFQRMRHGAVLKWVDVEDDGSFSMPAFEAALGPRTRFIAVAHMSNVLGTIFPIREICERAAQHGIPVLVDGSQAAVHMPVNVAGLGCDYYVFTGHKLYGPSGIGVLWGKRERLERLNPFMGGGEMVENVSTDQITWQPIPHRFEAGTPPIAQAVGLGAAIDYINALGMPQIMAHEADLAAYAASCLSQVKGLKMIGNATGKGAIFSFTLDDIHAHDLSTLLDRSGVAVRAGTHCAQPLLQRYGHGSTCRASLGLYNMREEIDILVCALEKARTFFA